MNVRHLLLGKCSRLLVAGAGLMLIAAGCESGDGTESPVTVAPETVTMQAGGTETVVLEASGGLAPYGWTVSDTTLGTVASSSQVAVYTRTAESGVNIVTATDTNGYSGRAMIYQDTTP
jgi:hypothetical protein